MNTQGTLSSWTKALFISIFCHSLFIFILFCLQTAPSDSQPEITELYEMDLTQSLADPSEPTANTPSDSVPTEDEQTLAITPSPTPENEKKAQESEQNLNPPLPDIKPPRTPTNDKQNTLEPKIKIETKVKPIYPEKFVQTKQHFTIILLVNISELGQPNLIQVKQSSGSTELDNAAIAAIKQWRYYPAIDLATGQQKSFVFPDFVVTDIDFTYPEKKLSQQSL
jgi:periplasmic protein TonB